MTFRNIITIFRKELQHYFSSPTAYLIAAIFWLISGFFFYSILLELIQSVAWQEQSGFLISVDVVYEFINSFLGIVIASLLLVLLPALSMGLYTEEKKQGTLELLATSPLTNWGIALGKLLAVLTFFTFMISPIWLYEIIIFSAAEPPVSLVIILLAHLGLILLAAAILSLGMFISALSNSAVLAYILTFICSLMLWILSFIGTLTEGFFREVIGGELGKNLGSFFKEVFAHIAWVDNYLNFIKGVFNSSSLVVFGSYIFLGIFLTAQTMESLRWQRR
jgi:ABC-2 type transport system permease protein